jgi:hypothetical protein
LSLKDGRRIAMEAIALRNEKIGKVSQKARTQDGVRDRSLPWRRFFLELLKMSINGSFVCEWEKKTGLPWREGW